MPVYFCHRGSPWQRPSNANTNGLLRDYFPKGTNLRVHTAADLAGSALNSTTGPARPSTGRHRTTCSLRSKQARCSDDY